MARALEQSDPDFPADSADTVERLELLEAFDEAIRARFGAFISAAVLKPTKRRRTR